MSVVVAAARRRPCADVGRRSSRGDGACGLGGGDGSDDGGRSKIHTRRRLVAVEAPFSGDGCRRRTKSGVVARFPSPLAHSSVCLPACLRAACASIAGVPLAVKPLADARRGTIVHRRRRRAAAATTTSRGRVEVWRERTSERRVVLCRGTRAPLGDIAALCCKRSRARLCPCRSSSSLVVDAAAVERIFILVAVVVATAVAEIAIVGVVVACSSFASPLCSCFCLSMHSTTTTTTRVRVTIGLTIVASIARATCCRDSCAHHLHDHD